MSVLWRIVSVAALVLSAGILVLAVRAVRREQRFRPGLDVLRLGVTLATTLLMAGLLGAVTSEALMGLGLVVGLALGFHEGLHVRVSFVGRSRFARRTALGVDARGLGVVAVPAAGDIEAADSIVGSLTADEAREVSAAGFA